jgi:hypothetical protein
MKYEIIFWGNSTDSKRVFQIQNKIPRIMTEPISISSCKPIIKALEILIVPAQYTPIIPLMTFMAHNLEHFTFNFSVCGINTRKKLQLHIPITNLRSFQKCVYKARINIFNKLPECTADLVRDKKHFLSALVFDPFILLLNF